MLTTFASSRMIPRMCGKRGVVDIPVILWQRADIVWMIREHGGSYQDTARRFDYILAPHGMFAAGASDSRAKYVSRNWLSHCVEVCPHYILHYLAHENS